MNISEIVKNWKRDGDWYISPGVDWCAKGNRVSVGYAVTIGDWARIGDRVTIGAWARTGDWARIGDGATIGDGMALGNWARIGDGATIGDGMALGDGATIDGGAIIGYGVRIGDGASIGRGATIGDGGTINSGARIGREAFVRDNCDRAVSLGYDSRDYALVVARQGGEPRFGAGCRWFTLDEAREHWGPGYNGDGDPRYFQIMIDTAERISALWEDES